MLLWKSISRYSMKTSVQISRAHVKCQKGLYNIYPSTVEKKHKHTHTHTITHKMGREINKEKTSEVLKKCTKFCEALHLQKDH